MAWDPAPPTLAPRTAIEYIDHIIDAYLVGDIDPEGSVRKLREMRRFFEDLAEEDIHDYLDR